MNKYSILKEIFLLENIGQKIANHSLKITEQQLLTCISKNEYNLKEELSLSATTVSRYIKILIPDKPSTTGKVCNFLLFKYGYKHCKKCNNVLELDLFYKNSSLKGGLSTYCKKCQAVLEKPTASARTAKYKASKLERTPKWLSIEEQKLIEKFYIDCPDGFHVDHIVPLQGEYVSGLHILANLQYLPAKENLSKSNKFMP